MKRMKELDILSYNIEFGKKFDDVVLWIEESELAPDIFCFQEFPEERVPFFKQFLHKRGYAYVYAPATTLFGVQVGQLTAYKKKRLALVNSITLDLGNHAWERRHKNVQGNRKALITFFKTNRKVFSVANVHLTVVSPHAMRYKQLQIVMEALHDDPAPVAIMGDFNYTSLFGVTRLFKFMGNYGYTCVGERMITHKIFKHIPQQLDYVFQKGFVPQEISVLKVPHSDHLPLLMKLSLV